jgi:hypothetical protein
MGWNTVPTELTTAATDAVLAILAIAALIVIRRHGSDDRWKVDLWSWLLGLLAAAAGLGAVAHGLELDERTRDLLWQPLYLFLGMVVALFVVAAVRDRFGERAARGALPWLILTGIGFFGVTRFVSGSFLLFVAYEGVAMLVALVLYADASVRRLSPGAGLMAVGVALNLIAAGIQQTAARVEIAGVPFDHNGLFHLIQMVALGVLTLGVLSSLTGPETDRTSAL